MSSRLARLLKELETSLTYAPVADKVSGSVLIRGFKLRDLRHLRQLYLDLNPSGSLSLARFLWGVIGYQRLLIVAEDIRTASLVGLDLFYFNPRDLQESTVHEGFVGVVSAYRGQGLATEMRIAAKRHFQRNGLTGISTRIAQDNKASLTSALKLGFEIVETQHSAADGESHYMVCKLGESK
ncbi:GNAT family N-acetyltransferase [Pseudomonas sp. G(2018)]|uniref:GNAT family N-acetyltransferase n=1 Tax=Pseudomonas sp. G(2018) TaxID=2502242 RepID=UPI0010F46790|nr:GNAT family protein [Pseudomonas sp. G(2018)]